MRYGLLRGLTDQLIPLVIRFRLRELLDARGMSRTDLQHESRLAYSTISELYQNKALRIDVGTLETLCETVGCNVAGIVEYIPQKKRQGGLSGCQTISGLIGAMTSSWKR